MNPPLKSLKHPSGFVAYANQMGRKKLFQSNSERIERI